MAETPVATNIISPGALLVNRTPAAWRHTGDSKIKLQMQAASTSVQTKLAENKTAHKSFTSFIM
jgi:hypothetical protein